MKYLLSKHCLSIVTALAKERTLCAFDYDGTLSPIVEHPDLAVMRVRTRNLLRRLTALYPCIIVSGRARENAIEKLNGVDVARVIGNHGAETEGAIESPGQIDQWKTALELELDPVPGVWVEDKGMSLAVHYRQSAQKSDARQRILAATQKLKTAHVFGGKEVVNLAVSGAPNKGDALAAERDRLGCNWVLYVGDDANDEDAFGVSGNLVSVRVGWKLRSRARYYLKTQAEIDELLELLVRVREQLAPA
ncbi:MAG: trehalose-phosphatase [Terracidiphilus sp.]|jgi:trehalose 6-phosphate phosphatase